jgi:hypothetical protein
VDLLIHNGVLFHMAASDFNQEIPEIQPGPPKFHLSKLEMWHKLGIIGDHWGTYPYKIPTYPHFSIFFSENAMHFC